MTHLDIEALSALIDGQATPPEEAHAASCPVCQESAARLRRAASAAGVPPVRRDPAQVDASVAAALAAWEGSPPVPAPTGDEPPGSAGRPSARGRPGWLVPSLAVAAAVFVVLGAVALLGQRSTPTSSSGASKGAAAAPSAGAADSASASLGVFSEPGPLVAAIRGRLAGEAPDTGSRASTTTSPGVQEPVVLAPACSAAVRAAALATPGAPSADGAPSPAGSLTWRGTPALAYLVPPVGRAPAAGAVVVVIASEALTPPPAGGCRVLATGRL
ncbi:hypothetical protein K6U06_01245 [Acidiferrimicrobium sp. IK]|uniref:hypothetical protein n=1 Tax=Acidiferrimicrobium sp. IK TaxID=2871700 RepID=UPI0021CAF04F|nr:hypothetical protein [Acidiferrimicrobium sp. IK]MCU4182972.1 hypothetical protein [Acidiferrimicrobium sp. IK]